MAGDGLRQFLRGSAREMRSHPTDVEKALWWRLRDRQLNGLKFRRQVPIGPFFADFACIECRVVVEVDGDTHDGREQYDNARTASLTAAGWLVLRVWNTQVYEEMDEVLKLITAACERRRVRT